MFCFVALDCVSTVDSVCLTACLPLTCRKMCVIEVVLPPPNRVRRNMVRRTRIVNGKKKQSLRCHGDVAHIACTGMIITGIIGYVNNNINNNNNSQV